jgi:ribonuclease E
VTVPEEHHMLDDDQPDRTDAGTDTPPVAPQPAAEPAGAPAAPVVTRRTRKAPAKKAAPAAAGEAEASAEAGSEPAADAPAAKKAPARRAPAKKAAARKTAAKKAARAPEPVADEPDDTDAAGEVHPSDAAAEAPVKKAAARRAPAKKAAARKAPAAKSAPAPEAAEDSSEIPVEEPADAATGHAVLFQAPVVTTTTRRARKKPQPVVAEPRDEPTTEAATGESAEASAEEPTPARAARTSASKKAAGKKRAPARDAGEADETATPGEDADQDAADAVEDEEVAAEAPAGSDEDTGDGEGGPARRRRRRGGRRRRKSSDAGGEGTEASDDASDEDVEGTEEPTDAGDEESGRGDSSEGNGEGTSRRRRRRRRAGEEGTSDDDDPHTVTRVRKGRSAEDQITAVSGSTRLEAKKQRRREGREAGRRRAPIVSEAEFLARRESVERVMVIRQREELTQIAVLEDKVLVEHYVARESQTSLIGNVYLGRVQNVLPSMEAAFIDIGKGRNAVLYAGEVNWSALGHKEGQPRKIESVLSSGQMVLVQVTKDPVGHKGARLTSQISLAGRFLVYVPDGTTSGISRKLPDTERNRLKTLLKEIVPDTAGVIVRTAAEGASEEELTRDVERLKSRWEDIEKKAANRGSGPQLLYGEPDLTLKVVRDLFTEDFVKLVIEGDDAWDTVHGYVESVAPDLAERVERFERGTTGGDVFATYRIDEQIHKGLDRKVWLPSGGSLIIDRTEAMTVVDVNTGKFTGSGGNLEETVTKNNLEAAEEIVRQLRLRDIGGIIVVDFIDMVLESNRDLVVRRLVECLGRDRTRHQVAEVTSLGLVQMTRKRIGTGLVEAFSENCEHCQGRGVVIKDQPVDPNAKAEDSEGRRGSRRRGRRGTATGEGNGGADRPAEHHAPSPKDVAAMARHEKPAEAPVEETPTETSADEPSGGEQATEAAAEKVAEAPPVGDESSGGEQATEAAAEKVAEAPPVEEAPAEAEKPRVVTRTRRRSASRPAGPPALPAVSGSGAGTVPESGVVEPGTVDAEPGVGTPLAEAAAPTEAHTEAPTVEHVPIKKKGSRKR